ncbi:hypothetical protein [Oceanirhabdus seepicola]|uniref:hypothetical protein n=1 Tax=Oceanirhabdus seepicola TaxID=2828781 RepID=UPI00203236F9
MHYSLDLWFEKVVKKSIKGKAYICRVADDFVCAFRYKEDAERFYKVIGKRLGKFGLSLAEEKTKIIKFSKYDDVRSKSFTWEEFNRATKRYGLIRLKITEKNYKQIKLKVCFD